MSYNMYRLIGVTFISIVVMICTMLLGKTLSEVCAYLAFLFAVDSFLQHIVINKLIRVLHKKVAEENKDGRESN